MEVQKVQNPFAAPPAPGQEAEQAAPVVVKKVANPFGENIDKATGAPAMVRAVVGSSPEADRLANIQQYFPDAQPYDGDNFVYTDPKSGRPTLYNPPGFDMGDIPAVAREGAQAVGSAFGATLFGGGALVAGQLGPQILTPEELVTVPLATAAGAGLGSEAGASVFDFVFSLLTPRIDTRNFGERMLDTAEGVLSAGAGQRAGELLGQGISAGVRKVVGGSRPAAIRMADAFRNLHIDPPAGAVSGSRGVQVTEKMLENSPFSAATLQRQAQRVLDEVSAAARKTATSFGDPKTKEGAGIVIKDAAVKVAARFGFKQEEIYDAAFDLIGADTRVAVPAVMALRETMETELAAAPKSLRSALAPAIAVLRSVETDAAEGIPFSALRQVRTMIGRDLATPVLAGSSGAKNEGLKRIYGALTEDLSNAAKQAGPEAAKKLAVADRYTRLFMTTANETMQEISEKSPESAFDFAMHAAKDGGSALTRMRKHFTPEEWDTVAATVLSRLGLAKPHVQDVSGEAFSVSTFLTNWNRLAPEAKKALFGGKRYEDLAPALDDLVTAIGALKNTEKLANTSNTAGQVNAYMALHVLSSGIGGMVLGGDVESAGTGVLSAVVAPHVAARLITNPKFIRWLGSALPDQSAIGPHIGRLVGIAADEPYIADAIAEYLQTLIGKEQETTK